MKNLKHEGFVSTDIRTEKFTELLSSKQTTGSRLQKKKYEITDFGVQTSIIKENTVVWDGIEITEIDDSTKSLIVGWNNLKGLSFLAKGNEVFEMVGSENNAFQTDDSLIQMNTQFEVIGFTDKKAVSPFNAPVGVTIDRRFADITVLKNGSNAEAIKLLPKLTVKKPKK